MNWGWEKTFRTLWERLNLDTSKLPVEYFQARDKAAADGRARKQSFEYLIKEAARRRARSIARAEEERVTPADAVHNSNVPLPKPRAPRAPRKPKAVGATAKKSGVPRAPKGSTDTKASRRKRNRADESDDESEDDANTSARARRGQDLDDANTDDIDDYIRYEENKNARAAPTHGRATRATASATPPM